MQPALALALCVLLIGLYYRQDIKQNPALPPSLWIAVAWFSLAGSRALIYWVHPELAETQLGDPGGSSLDRTVLLLLMAGALVSLLRRAEQVSAVLKSNPWLLLLYLYMGLSILWSENPTLGLKRYVRTVGDLLLALLVLTSPAPGEATRAVIRRTLVLLVPLSVVLIKYYRHLGVGYSYFGDTMWQGVTDHKNSLGQVCALAVVYFVSRMVGKRSSAAKIWDFLILAAAVWMLRGPQSWTSVTAVLTSFYALLSFFFLLRWPDSSRRWVWISVVGVVLFLVIQQTTSSSLAVAYSFFERDQTLTGRDDLWKEILRMGRENRLLGVGYGSFWTGRNLTELWRKFEWQPTSAHNGYLDAYLSMGLVGLALLILMLLTAMSQASKRSEGVINPLMVALLLVIIISNCAESSLLNPTSFYWFLFLIVGWGESTPPSTTGRVIQEA